MVQLFNDEIPDHRPPTIGSWKIAQLPRSTEPRDFRRGICFVDRPGDTLEIMERPQRLAVLNGGPMDGRQQNVEDDTDELSVVMSDGQQHRYLRTDRAQPLPHGGLVLVFDWVGRYYGPK
jgi:hypothetical protein